MADIIGSTVGQMMPNMGGLFWIGIILGAVILFVVFCYTFGFWLWNFPAQAIILEERDGGRRIKFDKARREIDANGIHYYRLKTSKAKTMPVPFKRIYLGPKGDTLLLFSAAQGNYVPLDIEHMQMMLVKQAILDESGNPKMDELGNQLFERNANGEFIVSPQLVENPAIRPMISEEVKQWFSSEIVLDSLRYGVKSMWEQVMPLLIIGAVAIGIMLIMYVSWDGMNKATSGMVSSQATIALSQENIALINERILLNFDRLADKLGMLNSTINVTTQHIGVLAPPS